MENDKFVNEGSEYMGISEENICYSCKNLISADERTCKAFKKIPSDIWEQEFIHTSKHPKQKNNIVFEAE